MPSSNQWCEFDGSRKRVCATGRGSMQSELRYRRERKTGQGRDNVAIDHKPARRQTDAIPDFSARFRAGGDFDRCNLRHLLRDGGCIDRRQLAQLPRCTLPLGSDRFWAKCAVTTETVVSPAAGTPHWVLRAVLTNFCGFEARCSGIGRFPCQLRGGMALRQAL